jgi:GAF domain-containing protein
MATDSQVDRIDSALDRLRDALPFSYAQWIVESPETRDYQVVISRCPAGSECYDIAHRPGVIGQVFRRERAIFLPNAQAHPLYDVFDPFVKWELAVPLVEEGKLAVVLNFEGGGNLELDGTLWQHLREALSSETGLQLTMTIPQPGEAWMVKTTYVEIPGTVETAIDAALRLGRAAADGGLSILVAGALDLPSSSIYPTVEEALATGVPLGGCFRGGGSRLDLLPSKSTATRSKDFPWWSLAEGRYDFVIVPSIGLNA